MSMLAGKSILVTGTSSGIGRAAALLFAREGARVTVASRSAGPNAELVDEIEAAGGTAQSVPTDVTDAGAVRALVEAHVGAYGRLDGAFNNAGTLGAFFPLVDQTDDDWDGTLGTNLRAVFLCLRAQARQMLAQDPGPGGARGAIVHTSSWLSRGALVGSAAYSASKAGLDGLARAAAVELAPNGVRVNTVNPGGIDTPMARDAFGHDEAALGAFGRAHPVGRMGTSEEVAEAVCWLLSDRASFVTGESLLVDGGYAVPGQRAD